MPVGPEGARPVRVLFVSQGGSVDPKGPAGHTAIEGSLRSGLENRPDLESRFVRLPAWSRAQTSMVRSVPGLRRLDADLMYARWHAVEGARGRRLLTEQVESFHPDVVYVDSHTAAIASPRLMNQLPFLLSVDAPMWDWRVMSTARPVQRHSRTSMAPVLRWESRAFGLAARVVCRSSWAADSVLASLPSARTVVIHPGLDVNLFTPAPREPRTLPRVLFVGARFRDKGGDTLLDALSPLLGRTCELDVVTPAALAPRHGMRVHRLGTYDPELIRLFQQADLLCLPTRWDSFGMVILEALACGTPVVASPAGAISELLDGGTYGRLVPAGDPVALRREVELLLGDPELRARLGVQGRSMIEKHYDARQQGEELLSVARECLVEWQSRAPLPRRPERARR